MGLKTVSNTAGADKEIAVNALGRDLQDKGFILTSTEDVINWARTGSLLSLIHISEPTRPY